MSNLVRAAARLRELWNAGNTTTAPGDGVLASRMGLRVESAAAPRRATVYLHGVVGDDWEGLDSATFVPALDALDVDDIDLRINSPGGLVFDGVGIYTALLEHKARVTAHVDGMAASAASFIAQAGDDILVKKPARMMIHDASAVAWGPPALMREVADLLDSLSDDIAGIYADRAGGKASTWRKAMTAETWYSSAQAVAAGLADRVVDSRGTQDAPEDRRSQLIRARARAANLVR